MSRLLTTEAAVRAAVINIARQQIGFQGKVGGWTKYGEWYGPGWGNAYFCAGGWSWCWNMALGETDAQAVIDYQRVGGNAPKKRGFIWTVAIIEQHRAKKVLLKDLRPGDALLFRYNSGDNRQGNEVNHVDLVEVNHPNLGYVDCIGFNVPKPGAPAGSDPGRGGGVWRRRIWYSDKSIVAGLRMPAAALAERNRKAWASIQNLLNDFRLGEFQRTGTPGPATQAAVKEYAKLYSYNGAQDDPLALLPHMEEQMKNIVRELATLTDLLQRVRDEQANHGKILNNHGQALGRVLEQTTPTAIGDAVWTHERYGFTMHWWVRQGGITTPEHKNFPADPGSPADKLYRQEAAANDGHIKVYLPTGDITMRLDEKRNKFVQVKN